MPGSRLQLITVLLPHIPMRDASELAGSITVLADHPGIAAVQIMQGSQCEIAMLNPKGTKLELGITSGSLYTDGMAVYLNFEDSILHSVLVLQVF